MHVRTQLVHFARLHGLSKRDAESSAQRWISRLGLEGFAEQSLESLSLGNQQRVQLATALVHDPALLVLDEPFSGLDPLAVDTMCGVLSDKAAEGVPIVFSSHQLELVERMCNRVGVLHQRQLTELDLSGEASARTEIEIVAPACPAGWTETLPGVTVVDDSEGRVVLVLDSRTDDRDVLVLALQHGPVHEFRRRRLSLMARYREAVGA